MAEGTRLATPHGCKGFCKRQKCVKSVEGFRDQRGIQAGPEDPRELGWQLGHVSLEIFITEILITEIYRERPAGAAWQVRA